MNKYTIGALLWAAIILFLTLTPGKYLPQVGVFSYDKLGHSAIFGIQAFLITAAFQAHRKTNNVLRSSLWYGSLITFFYGNGLEIMQDFIPGRAMDWVDAIANTLGVLLGVLAYYLLNKRRT